MRNVHKIDTRLIAIPIEAQTEDCGSKFCKVPQLVLSEKTDVTNWKNDRTAFAFKFDSMTVKLVSATDEVEAIGYVFTFPNQPDATGFVIDWRQNEYGCFKVKIEWEISGVTGWFYYGQYVHRPYTCENANGTVRLFVHLDDFVRKQGINYKGSGFYGTIRFNGVFGFMQPNYDTENLIYSDRVRHKVRIEAIRSYELRTDQLLYAMTRLIDEDVLLTANNILITDHNPYNHSQEFKDFPVILSESESPKFEYSNPFSSITAVFNEKVAVSESRYSSDINAPIPIVQTVITTTPDATIEVNGNEFGTVSSGGTIDIPVVNGGSNPVGTIDGGQVVIGDSSVFINGTQVGDIVAEDSLSIAVELDGVPSGTWNATDQVWEVESTPSDAWVRPSDWLPIPNIDTSEQVFYGLCMVYQDQANLVSLRFTGNYTVDWGDGVVENFASNVVAHHQYSWSSVGNVTSEGFRQALIKVTPQVGQNLTGINLQFKHPSMGGGNLKGSIFIDMVMNLPQLAIGASIVLGGTTFIRHFFVERLNIMSIGSATSLSSLCSVFNKLQKFEIGDTSNVTNMTSMFYDCYTLQSVPLFNTANVTNMANMFANCFSLTTVPLFNTASVQIMTSMFQNCFSLTTVPLFNTANVTNMIAMFQNCYSLQTVPLFNTASVTNMQNMFQYCVTLTTVPLFNTANVTNMQNMFHNCYTLQSVPLFNTTNVTNMINMFFSCNTLQSVPLFNTTNVTNMTGMFYGCFSLTTVPLFNTASVTNMTNMFFSCVMLKSTNLNLSSVSVLASTFSGTVNIETLILSGCRYGFNIANNEMSASALNALFTSLGTAVGSQTITVTGNPGALTCNTSIATSKGFTVVI